MAEWDDGNLTHYPIQSTIIKKQNEDEQNHEKSVKSWNIARYKTAINDNWLHKLISDIKSIYLCSIFCGLKTTPEKELSIDVWNI